MAEHLVQKNYDSTYCNSFNIKLYHGYFSLNITKFSEQVSLKHLQEHDILLMNKSEATSNYSLNLFSETCYKKQNVFGFHSTYSCDILQFDSMGLCLIKLGLPDWARIKFMIYWTWSWKILELTWNWTWKVLRLPYWS